ncbi:MAG: isoamylase early set domain-containing protein [Deferrisomatales bacterium]
MNETERLHRILDGEGGERPAPGTAEAARLADYEDALALLAEDVEPAPADLVARVLGALPDTPAPSWAERLRGLWPGGARWVAPALAGALAAAVLAVGVRPWVPGARDGAVAVTFEVHAPGARQVELVGSFNEWRPGQIVLHGPDAAGHWSATVELPAGRHEYLFLVDGRDWVTDPRAAAHRPDGFGRENALLEL